MDKFVIKKQKSPGEQQQGLESTSDTDHPSHPGRGQENPEGVRNEAGAGRGASSEGSGPVAPSTPHVKGKWQHIEAEGLDCDYAVIFTRSEADDIFLRLERELEYFSGDLSRVQVYGKWYEIPRKQVAHGDPNLTYKYSGVCLSPKPWLPVLEGIRDRVRETTGHSFNFVLINRYKDGNDHIGKHRDDERELERGSPIASVSFGAARDFVFHRVDPGAGASGRRLEPVKLLLGHGSLLLMKQPTNVHWCHSLPVRKRVHAPRVNLTFRKLLRLGER